jgi:hypothetical protein
MAAKAESAIFEALVVIAWTIAHVADPSHRRDPRSCP